jgi:hypothetical protein
VKNRRPRQQRGDDLSQATRRREPLVTTWLFVGILFLVAAALAYVTVAWILRPTLPDALIGDRRIEGGQMSGAQHSFSRDGQFTATFVVDGKEAQVDAVVQKHSDTLRYTIVAPNGRTTTKTQTIKRLTEQEMINEENRQQSRLVRISK